MHATMKAILYRAKSGTAVCSYVTIGQNKILRTRIQ